MSFIQEVNRRKEARKVPDAQCSPETGRFVVTPQVAEAWLRDWNVGNRPPRENLVRKIVGALHRGEWRYNGIPIAFSTSRLLNGQHRLMACASSGIAFDTAVITGLSEEVFTTFDTQGTRTNADFLSADGYANTHSLASAATWLWRFLNNKMTSNETPSPHEVVEILTRHPDLQSSLRFVRTGRHSLSQGFSGAIALHYLVNSDHPVEVIEFFDSLSSGINLQAGSPVLALRKQLLDDALRKRKMRGREKMAIYIKAWNAFIKGVTVQHIVYRSQGEKPEKFPSLICT